MKLSDKEKIILNNLCSGMNIVQISKKLSYSERQIRRIVKKLYEKFGVSNINALCFEWGKIQH